VITGFEPFDGLPHNPSAALLAHLPATLGGRALHTAVLPVDSARIGDALAALPMDAALVLHLGLAADRPALTLERVGLNLLDFSRPDNAGRTVVDAEVVPGAPLALPGAPAGARDPGGLARGGHRGHDQHLGRHVPVQPGAVPEPAPARARCALWASCTCRPTRRWPRAAGCRTSRWPCRWRRWCACSRWCSPTGSSREGRHRVRTRARANHAGVE
jgi:hypothetical protein